ncbi:MAG: 6,7-dimethyl-8-ribityllumazine synthase [Candidatus Rokubacteria bacterium]|nr:6,7-dimethyl-8-ribityllumazine synthase [Candidatus Rokubacteria bacterium]
MAGPAPPAASRLRASGRRVAIVASRFHEAITVRLVSGARAALLRHGVRAGDVRIVWVSGAFDLPQAAARVARRGDVDALVCVGCVIRGETPHFEYVAGEAARGISEVGRSTGVPTTFGVITANTREQAEARAGGAVGNRGEEAALAALELLALFAELRGRRGRARAKARRSTR